MFLIALRLLLAIVVDGLMFVEKGKQETRRRSMLTDDDYLGPVQH
jgi:hypothetical protein